MGGARLERATSCLYGASRCCGLPLPHCLQDGRADLPPHADKISAWVSCRRAGIERRRRIASTFPEDLLQDLRARLSRTRWPIRQSASRHGSSRSSAAGPTATATSSARSDSTPCSRTSRSTGRPRRSTRRSGRTTPSGTSRGLSRLGSAWRRRPRTRLSPARSAIPRARFAEQVFNIQRWTEMPRGGHFAALEVPDLLAADVAEFFRSLRER
jgi:hypothetical protein